MIGLDIAMLSNGMGVGMGMGMETACWSTYVNLCVPTTSSPETISSQYSTTGGQPSHRRAINCRLGSALCYHCHASYGLN